MLCAACFGLDQPLRQQRASSAQTTCRVHVVRELRGVQVRLGRVSRRLALRPPAALDPLEQDRVEERLLDLAGHELVLLVLLQVVDLDLRDARVRSASRSLG